MSYQSILIKAWKTTWKNKYMWFFGIFAVLLGNSGGAEVIFQLFNNQSGTGFFAGFRRYVETGIFSRLAMTNLGSFIAEDPLSFIILVTVLLLFVVLGGFLIWLAVVSQSALVNNSAQAISGKNHNFKNGLDSGIKNFWPVLGLNVISKILVALSIFLISFPVLVSAKILSITMSNLLFIILFIVIIPVIVALSFVIKYATCFVVLKDHKLKAAIQDAWKLFISNWIVSLEMAFTLLIINFLVTLALVLTFLIISIPLLFIAIAFAKLTFFFFFWLIVFTSLILFFALIVFTGATLTTFQITSWTALFVQLIGKGGKSKIVQFFERKK